MQRLIRSFNTLTDTLKETLQEQYPDGIDASHIKTIPTAKGDILRVIELSTPDAMYLIKINPESRAEIDEFLEQDDAASAPAEDLEDNADIEGGDTPEVEGDDDQDDTDADDADGDDDTDPDDVADEDADDED
jgi:DNA-directed RNA polymerase subunit delta